MFHYFARCLRGLEEIVGEELTQIEGVHLIRKEIRTLFFTYVENPDRLLALKSVDDMFFHLGEIKDLDHTRATLYALAQSLKTLDLSLEPFIRKIKEIRNIPASPSFTLTVGLQGKKNFSRFEVVQEVLPFFEEHLSGKFVPNESGSQGADLDFRILMEGNRLHLGLRLAKEPLHRRPYKIHNLPGSTKPPLAYVMAKLAHIKPTDHVVDPCCGVGTVLIEAALSFAAGTYEGRDIQAESIALSLKNIEAAGLEVPVKKEDVREFLFSKESIDKIITNPPWGRQVAKKVNLDAWYDSFFSNCYQMLKSGGRMVLLTDQVDWMQTYFRTSQLYSLEREISLSLFGSLVKIYVLDKV